jgi:multidrug efflux pump
VNLSAPFISRPVATTLLTIGIALAGLLAFFRLPVSPLPQVDFPTISITAQLPGASPDTVATSVASPLERHLGQIADVTEMTSQSSVGQARITLQFGLDRDIDGAARDVQAAINAAHADLPTSLKSNPTYRKVNPADAPVLILALTSKTLTRGQLYDAASNVLEQSLSQISGIGQVIIGGAALPAVRVELNPTALFNYGIGLEDVRAALASANANSPKGAIEQAGRHYQLYTNDQASHAADYVPLVVAYRNSAAVRLSDVADVQDSVEDLRNAGLSNGQPSVLVILFRQPGANIIDTVDRVKAELPHLKAAMPADVDITEAADRTTTIRASLFDTERTLVIAVILVTAVVFLFLRDARATLIPSIAVPVSIIGTFGTMYLLGFSLDNLSLMALTVATGFVVDDAIVVLENIERHLEEGVPRLQAALLGAREVGFTVVSISISLIAVFIPILLMGGIVGRLFREFALTLSLAILVSLLISLTTTPMMCALFLRTRKKKSGRSLFDRVVAGYGRTLGWALRHGVLVMLILGTTIGLNVLLYIIIPKGFFPEQDTGRLVGSITADQSISFQAMQGKLAELMSIVQHDKAVENVVGFSGGGGGGRSQTNTASVYVSLKPVAQRSDTADQVIARLRRALSHVSGATLFLVAVQDIRIGGRQSNAAYQYTLQGDSTEEVYKWAPKLTAALQRSPVLADVNSDQQQKGLETDIVIDRDSAARFGLNEAEIDNTLYDAFGQRQVSTIYSALNQYHVVMEVAPRYWQSPQTLRDLYVSTSGGNASGTQTTQLLDNTASAPSSSGGSSHPATSFVTSALTPITSGFSASAAAISPTTSTSTSSTASYASLSAIISPSSSATSTPGASPTTSGSSGSSGSSASAASSAASVSSVASVRNAATNALANVGKGSASSGAAVSTNVETMVPLAAFTKFGPGNTPLAVNHQGLFVATTISFNLALGKSLSDATAAIAAASHQIGMPASIHGSFAGTAQVYQQSLASEPVLILAALFAVYIVLGILYESFIHPITIISTLPSAGVGAVLALMLFNTEFSIIALIGVILLIGIVKKNAILMIDFAIHAERNENATPRDAIFQACLLRFRPIMMTTMAAMLGAVPLALSFGDGGEIRRPLGIAIVGGLMLSQVLTLYTTPVLYLYLARYRLWALRHWSRAFPALGTSGHAPEAAE